MTNLEALMTQHGTPSLKAFSKLFNLNQSRLYRIAKQPEDDVIYTAGHYNWGAVERFIMRRLDPVNGLATLEDVVKAALQIETEMRANDGRRRSNTGESAMWGHKVEIDGKMVPQRRFANFEKESGQLVVLKDDTEVYAIVIQTASHTVLRPVSSPDKDDNGDWQFKGNNIICISNGMLNLRGVGPSGLTTGIQERFDGTYAKRLAKEVMEKAAVKAMEAEAFLKSYEESKLESYGPGDRGPDGDPGVPFPDFVM